MTEFYKELGDSEKAMKFELIASEWLEAVSQVLWHDEIGVWLDYDMMNHIKRDYFYPTNIAPLWTMCYHRENTTHYVSKVPPPININAHQTLKNTQFYTNIWIEYPRPDGLWPPL